jgi:hypothetical protein
MHDIHPKLDKGQFKTRTGELFASFYMSMVSIIQGVAIAIFIQNAFNLHYDLFVFLRVVVTFFYIVAVTYEYATFAGIWRWPHRIWDVAIPLLLGIAQSAPSFLWQNPVKWWGASLGLVICGLFAYFNTGRQLRRNIFEEGKRGKDAYNSSRGVSARGNWLMLAGVPICVVAIFWHIYGTPGPWVQIAMLLLIFLVVVLFIWKQQNWYRKMHEMYGFRWTPGN